MKLFHRWSKGWTGGPSGLLCVSWGRGNRAAGERLAFHVLVRRSSWIWGYATEYYDGNHYFVGLGPLFLLAWSES